MLCEQHVPIKNNNSKVKKSVWMNKKSIKTINKRNSAWNKYKKVRSDETTRRTQKQGGETYSQ